MKNLLLRIISSLLLGFIFIFLTNLGGFYFKILLIIIFCFGFFEIYKIKNFKIVILILLIFIIFLLSFYSLRLNSNGLFLTFWCLLITWLTDIFAFVFGKLFGKKKIGIISPNKTYFGFIFIFLTNLGGFYFNVLLIIIFCFGFFEIYKIKNFKIVILILLIFIIFLLSFYSLRLNSNGLFLTFWCLLITWLTDIFAFFFGKLFGKKKIGIISPNKTYFGFISGIIISQISYPLTNILIKDFFVLDIKKIFLIQLLVSILVIFGDLFFSFLKRKLNIKDFSQLIPGHGGIFDRIDGLIFSITAFNFIFTL